MRLAALLLLLVIVAREGTAADQVDYSKEIKPLLSQNCVQCHGPTTQKGGLRLDTAAAALKGGQDGPAIIPGQGAKSLLVQALLGSADGIHRMPLKKDPLPPGQILRIQLWVDQGAVAPRNEKSEDGPKHWAFVAPVRPAPPDVKQKSWTRNDIDRFVLARLEAAGIKPSPEADRATLARRVSLDLTGLPPTPAEVEAFLADKGSQAYERLVERLLASPHYGERWGRHWLDVARYADSNGYSIDGPRSIWKYRDWVIEVLNKDLPFDQFTIDQLAGDMLPGADDGLKIATGFHRNTMINEEGGIDKEQFRIESIIDRVNTTGAAFLGLTVGCCQCHDHKFDPITQKEYYQLFAFFNNADEPALDLAGPKELAQRQELRQQIKALEAGLEKFIDGFAQEQSSWEKSLTPEDVARLKAETTTILETPPAKRTAKQKRDLARVFRNNDPEFKNRLAEITRLEAREKEVSESATTLVVKERSTPRKSYIFIKGDFTRHGDDVTPGVPAILPPLAAAAAPTRLDLAKWIVDPRNPLTARVIVNRMWQEYFGRGIVETENDFGLQGARPSHPQLLDWLATELIRQHWSLKAMHRLIVTSATYRQSSRARPDLAIVDPNNRLLARQARLRLDAEIIRDVALSASGRLNGAIGGPSVFPPQPDGVMTLGQTKREWKTSSGADRFRRGMYTFFWRATPNPALVVFDAPDATSACTRRARSNTPLQSLTLLNDEGFFELAQAMAARVLKEAPNHHPLDYAFELCTARKPTWSERNRLQQLLDQQLLEDKTSPEAAQSPPGDGKGGDSAPGRQTAWTTVARVLLNLDETITRE
jgi:mono/diheme cytochrome c family protein